MAGELTVTVVGTYATVELAVAAMDLGTDTSIEDYHKIIPLTGTIPPSFKVIKSVRAQ